MLPSNTIGTRVNNVYWFSSKLQRKKIKKPITYSNNGITLLLTIYNCVILHIIIDNYETFIYHSQIFSIAHSCSYNAILPPVLPHLECNSVHLCSTSSTSQPQNLGCPLGCLCHPTGLGSARTAGWRCLHLCHQKSNLLCGLFDFTPYCPFSAISTHNFSLLLFPFSAWFPQKYTICFY